MSDLNLTHPDVKSLPLKDGLSILLNRVDVFHHKPGENGVVASSRDVLRTNFSPLLLLLMEKGVDIGTEGLTTPEAILKKLLDSDSIPRVDDDLKKALSNLMGLSDEEWLKEAVDISHSSESGCPVEKLCQLAIEQLSEQSQTALASLSM